MSYGARFNCRFCWGFGRTTEKRVKLSLKGKTYRMIKYMAGWVSEVAMFTIHPVILREQNVLDMFKKSPHLFADVCCVPSVFDWPDVRFARLT